MEFSISATPLEEYDLKERLKDPTAGGYVCFEGWVRNRNEGKSVTHLEYQAYDVLAVKEGNRILAEAKERFDIQECSCVHRVGDLAIGEMAVWVGVGAVHRGTAFDACEYIIDELKIRVPIWKKEHYVDDDSGWIECHECSKHVHDHQHTHDH